MHFLQKQSSGTVAEENNCDMDSQFIDDSETSLKSIENPSVRLGLNCRSQVIESEKCLTETNCVEGQNCDKLIQHGEGSYKNLKLTHNCDRDSSLTQNCCPTDFKQPENNCTNMKSFKTYHTESQQVEHFRTNSKQPEADCTNLEQPQFCYPKLPLSGENPTDLQLSENCHSNILQTQNCQLQASCRDLMRSHDSNTRLKPIQNCPVDLLISQNSPTDFEQTNSAHTESEQCDLDTGACAVSAEVEPVSDNSSGSSEGCLNHSCDYPMMDIKTEKPDGDEVSPVARAIKMEIPDDGDDETLHFKMDVKIEKQDDEEVLPFMKNVKIEKTDDEVSAVMRDERNEKSDDGQVSPVMMNERTEEPDDDENSPLQDLKRSRRSCKRKRDQEDFCPVCGLTIRYSELESHFAKEVENLSTIAKNIRKPRRSTRDKEGVNNTFVQVKCNRENRLAAKVARYTKKNDVQCPVCKLRLSGTERDINEHVLNCAEEDYDSDINVVDHDGMIEEYDFGDETRVRAISLVPGGYRSLHGYSSKTKPDEDDDEDDLNVDVDDTFTYGKPQYTELDIIHNTSNALEVKEMEQLRRAVILDPAAEPHIIEGKKWSQENEIANEVAEITRSCFKNTLKADQESKNNTDEECVQKVESTIISSLKERIKDLEQQKNVKCLICLEPFTKPVVSTTCWHVHCEECWLVSMGVKKLCPQCNMIVFPTDLRRIYL